MGKSEWNLAEKSGRMRGMDFEAKIFLMGELLKWREGLRASGKTLVATNGCFDILHAGHVGYLQAARKLGDALLVGVTSDRKVGTLKGPGRPINGERDRAMVLAALEAVDGVFVFPELDARTFLTEVKPDVYAKGGDYTIDTINQDERRLLESMGCRIVVLPVVPGKSTSALLQKIATL